MVEHQPVKGEALSSNLDAKKKKKTEKKTKISIFMKRWENS
jgi:hypothetical protein